MRFYAVINALSLDVAIGAMVGMAFFARCFDVCLDPFTFPVMGSTVWVIYTTDHLLDALRIQEPASTYRHKFHQEHFVALLLLVLIVSAINLIVVITTIQTLIVPGGILIGMVVCYLILHPFLHGAKELAGACLYTMGVVLPSLEGLFHVAIDSVIIVSSFMLVAWMNLLIFSLADRQSDRNDRMLSFTQIFGAGQSRRLILAIYALLCIGCVSLIVRSETVIALILFVMGSILILTTASHISRWNPTLFRMIGDSVFYLPLLYLIV